MAKKPKEVVGNTGTAAPVVPALDVTASPSTVAPAVVQKPEMRDAVFVKSVPVSVRRCGFRFDRDGCGIELSVLSAEQIELLENDPDLIVERCQFPMDEDA